MMDKLNISAVEEYSESYAKRLTNYFFIDNEAISGKEILTLSDVQQVKCPVRSLATRDSPDEKPLFRL
jgi:hypothetical protein